MARNVRTDSIFGFANELHYKVPAQTFEGDIYVFTESVEEFSHLMDLIMA